MRFSTISLPALAALLPLTLAVANPSNGESSVGKAIVKNQCEFPVHLWSVGSEIGPRQTLDDRTGSYEEDIHRDPVSAGIALKITLDENGLFNGSPQLIDAYTLDGNRVFYDLSSVFGNPFAGHRIVLDATEPGCRDTVWEQGIRTAGALSTTDCVASTDLVLTLCA
ncbi:hypothetical protein VTO42DRAFT_7059 [Malbranchea cinnamomea]